MDMRSVKCILLGNEDVDKRELFFKILEILSILKPKKEKPQAADYSEVLERDIDFPKSGSVLSDGEESDFEKVTQPTRFQVLHHTEDEEASSDDESDDDDDMETWNGPITVDGKTFSLEIYDSSSQEAFDQLRPELYPDTDVFLICFSVILQNSLQDVENKWVPEVKKFCPVTPFLLVGTHANWRVLGNHDQVADRDAADRPVYPETGAMYANRIGAVRYMECSTNDPTAVRSIFDEAVRVSCMDRMELSQLLPDFVKFGYTLLHQAAQVNHEPSIEALAYVMDINIKDRNGRRPLDIATRSNHLESARRLILSGAEVKLENEDWQKRCEFWVDESDTEHVVHRNINELARRVLNVYAGWDTPLDANILLIGQHGIEVSKFLRESAPYIPIKCLGIINTEGPCTFDFSMLQLSISCLTITDCDLGEVHHSVYELVHLERLSLVSCNVTCLKSEISNLRHLQRLRLSDNKLKSLPDTIGRLHNLRFIHCDYNHIQSLPDQMGCLCNLEVLELSHNKLQKLSVSLGLLSKLKRLTFEKNRELKFPPEDVLKKGSDEILEFLNNFLDDPVPNKQVKVTVVGGEGVGKSTLVRALALKRNWKFSVLDSAEKTKGVEISDIELNESLRMKVFDLGGDASYLNIHSLFLSENSLYQAVIDMSRYTVSGCSGNGACSQLGMLELWLQIVYSQAPNSHVVIVATNAGHPDLTEHHRSQVKEDIERMLAKYRKGHKSQFGGDAVPHCALCDETYLCDVSSAQFYIRQQPDAAAASKNPEPCIPHVVGFYEISCMEPYPKIFLSSKNLGLQKLKIGLTLKMEVLLSSNVGSRIPQKCLYFRDRVLEILQTDAELQEQPIITLTRLREIALGCGMRDDHKLKAMISYFHTQGDFLWFEDVPELSQVVFINPQWLADQLRTLYPPYSGHHCVAHGILNTVNLAKLWPDYTPSERETLLSLVRKLGLCFEVSEDEDWFPSLFPLGSPDKESWLAMPSLGQHQLTVEFAFSFLPPTFFSDLIIVMNKRELVSAEASEPTYYRLHAVFSTFLTATEGCILHNRENRLSSPLEQLDHDAEGIHVVHVESVPHAAVLRATVRGPMPCCVLPEVRAAVKSVSDVRYPGIRFNELLICPVCEIIRDATAKTPAYLHDLCETSNKCAMGHDCGSKAELLSGCIPEALVSPCRLRDEKALRTTLEDHLCPKLFIVLPIGFQSPALRRCHVLSHVPDGYAVHFLCECPGYWHLVPAPGYRIARPEEFFARFGERACRLLKVIFLMGDEDSLTYPSLKNFLLKIVVGDPTQRENLASDLKNLLEHYYQAFPEVVEGCSHFTDEDLEYLVCGKDLRRSKLARMLELSSEGRAFGPLVCTYVERHKENMWLCRKHALPVSHAAANGTPS